MSTKHFKLTWKSEAKEPELEPIAIEDWQEDKHGKPWAVFQYLEPDKKSQLTDGAPMHEIIAASEMELLMECWHDIDNMRTRAKSLNQSAKDRRKQFMDALWDQERDL